MGNLDGVEMKFCGGGDGENPQERDGMGYDKFMGCDGVNLFYHVTVC